MTRNTALPAAYIIVYNEDKTKILLSQRKNTGYMDGFYQMPAGHIEDQETPEACAIRELKEEVGLTVAPENLSFAYISYSARHDKTDNRVDLFFEVQKYTGEIINPEPHKAGDWEWFSLDNLPEDIIYIVKNALNNIANGVSYKGMSVDYLKSIGQYQLQD